MVTRKQKLIGIPVSSFLFLTILAIAGLFYLQRPGPAPVPADSTIVAFGDSLVEGVGASPGGDIATVLSKRIGVPIVNAGNTGDTTGDALLRINEDVLSHNPTVVVVLLGGNDILYLVPKDVMFKNLEKIVLRLTDSGAKVLLLGIRCPVVADKCADEYLKLDGFYNVTVLTAILDDIILRPSLMSDPIHPNDNGYVVMADKIEPWLRALLE